MTESENPEKRAAATIRELIDQQDQQYPNKVFLLKTPDSPEKNLTFQELRQYALTVGIKLRDCGLSTSDRVAIILPNNLEYAAILLGLLYNGFVPVALSVTSNERELNILLKQSDPKLLIVASNDLERVKQLIGSGHEDITIQTLDQITQLNSAANHEISSHPLPLITAKSEALIDFTSGSSDSPKGVLVSHANLLAGASNSLTALALTPSDRSLCVMPLHHMNAQVISLLSTLLSAGSIVIAPTFQASLFWFWLKREQCTWFTLTPSMIAQLLELADLEQSIFSENLDQVRFARSSSAPLSPDLHQKFESIFNIPLIEGMGSTEACSAFFSSPLPPRRRKIGSPGIASNFQVRIVDQQGRDLHDNKIGEVRLKGPSVMIGYFRDPAATQKTLDENGWLRTGDLAYRDEDGFYFITGRSRELIIKSGENISPREIDEALMRHPAIYEAAATAIPHPILGEDIVAFIKVTSQAEISETELIKWCSDELGLFKTPSHLFFVNKFPRGTAGKILRKALSKKAVSLIASNGNKPLTLPTTDKAMQPRTPIERLLHDIWIEYLDCKTIGIQDHFFKAGGQSLIAIQVIARIHHELSVDLPLGDFLSHPTIESQALIITERLLDDSSDQCLDESE